MTPSDIQRALSHLAPLVADYWERPLRSYAAVAYDEFEAVGLDIRQEAFSKFCSMLHSRLIRDGFNETEIQQLVAQLRRRPVIQTGPHCHLIIEPDAFFTHLFSLMGLKAHGEGWYVNYSVSTVKFTESAKKGPGWLWLDGQNVNVFGLSRSKMVPYSIYGRHGLCRFALKPDEGETDHPLLDQLRTVLPERSFNSAADAIKSGNLCLWRQCMGTEVNFLQLDDSDVTELVLEHLADTKSWLSSRFIDAPDMVASFLRAVQEVDSGAWSGWFKFNTHFFWLVRDGRLRRLILEKDRLCDDSRSFQVSFNSQILAQSLKKREIVPSLFLALLVIGILPGMRTLGGSRQVIYYPLMRLVLLMALDRSGAPIDKALARSIRSDNTPSIWGHRTIAPTCQDPWRLFAAPGLPALAPLLKGFETRTLRETSADLPGFVTDEMWARCCPWAGNSRFPRLNSNHG